MGGSSHLGKILIGIGIVCIIAGLVISVLCRWIHLGKSPGDILVNGEHGTFYFPVVSCILISIILSVLLNLFHR